MSKCCYICWLLLLSAACTWDKPTPVPVATANTDTASCIPDTVRLSLHLQPLFNYNCTGTYCHSGITPPGRVNLESGKSFASMHDGGYIDTENPSQSLIYAQMFSVTKPMPPYGTLPKCKTDLILKWIQQGALDN